MSARSPVSEAPYSVRHQFYTADVFTESPFGGNQLAVFPNSSGLSSEQMQKIARELNLSETVFVLPPQDSTRNAASSRRPAPAANPQRFRLRIFTPQIEVPFAGHPTVGTAWVLAVIGEVELTGNETQVVFEQGVGPVPVTLRTEHGQPKDVQFTTAMLPEFGPPPPPAGDLARMLALDVSDLLLETRPPMAVSCGLPYLIIPLRDLGAAHRAQLEPVQWSKLVADYWAPHVYIFVHQAELEGCDLHARMFAPGAGVAEDPATGSAAAALAGMLAARSPEIDGTLRWVVEQGLEIDRPSVIELEADKIGGEIVAVRVAGSAVMMSEGTMTIPARLEH